jgi:phosphotransferase system IIB component
MPTNKSDYRGLDELDQVEAVMFAYASKFLKLAQAKIQQKKAIDQGNLSDLGVSDVISDGNKVQVTVGYDKSNPASEYYDFKDKGVKGLKGNQKTPYKFKNLKVGRNFLATLIEWYERHRSYIKNETQTRNLSGLQRKRKKLGEMTDADRLKSIAYLTGKKIKRKGIDRIGFFDDNIDKVFNEQFKKDLAEAMGKDIILNITSNFKTK